jgi:hypothetical protein
MHWSVPFRSVPSRPVPSRPGPIRSDPVVIYRLVAALNPSLLDESPGDAKTKKFFSLGASPWTYAHKESRSRASRRKRSGKVKGAKRCAYRLCKGMTRKIYAVGFEGHECTLRGDEKERRERKEGDKPILRRTGSYGR